MMKPSTPQYAVFSSTEEGCCYLLCSDIIGYAPLMDAFLGNEMFEADEVTCHHQFVLGNERFGKCNVLHLRYIHSDEYQDIEVKALAEFIRIAEEKSWMKLLQ